MKVSLRPSLWALLFASAAMLLGAPVSFIHPLRNETISGIYQVSVQSNDAAKIAAVEYSTGSHRLALVTMPPFGFSWNTAYVSDGNYSLEAKVYDAWGRIIATDDTAISVRNRDCKLVVNSPDLSETLRGSIRLSLTGSDSRYYPARWNIFIDGTLMGTTWTDNSGRHSISVTPVLDTTRFKNGKHELHIEIGSDYWPGNNRTTTSWHEYRLCLHRVITIDNHHTLTAISANYQHLYLEPDQSTRLTCHALFTDETTESCSAVSFTTDSNILNVDSSGRIRAGAHEGFTRIDLKSEGKTASVYAWVRNDLRTPNFSGNGEMLTGYSGGKSIFVIAPFVLEPSDIRDAATNAEVKRAGVNTLYSGFYSNPRRIQADYQAWRDNYDSTFGASWRKASAHGYHLYVMGDDITRNLGGDAWWTLNWPFARYAVQHAMESLAKSGVAIAADIIDEGSMMWGSTPTPARRIGERGMFESVTCRGLRCTVAWPTKVRPSRFFAGTQFALAGSRNPNLNTPPGQMFQATNFTQNSFDFAPTGPVEGIFTPGNDPDLEFLWWAGRADGCPTSPCNPPVPNTALSTIAEWLRSAPAHVPISWPALGIDPPIVHGNWAGRESQVSDFMSHYWDTFQEGRTYAWSSGITERVFWMRNAFYSRQPHVRLDRPQIMLDSISSYYYRKNTPGAAYYHPPEDDLLAPGTSGAAVFAGMLTAAAIGNAGVRLYQFEKSQSEASRAAAPLGSELQTGASPFARDERANENWRAMGYAAGLLTKRLQPFILATALPSPAIDGNIVTAARQSDSGTLLVAINANDWERNIRIDLSPYVRSNPLSRYIAGASGIRTAILQPAKQDEVLLGPGEAVVYLFPDSPSRRFVTPAHVSAPRFPLNTSARRAVLHYAYIYSDDVFNEMGIDCTTGCDVDVDKDLGDILYQFLFLDQDGNVVRRGPVIKLADFESGPESLSSKSAREANFTRRGTRDKAMMSAKSRNCQLVHRCLRSLLLCPPQSPLHH